MSPSSMHPDQLPIDVDLVGRLLADQFPHWTGRSLRPVESDGTENAIFRLGDDLAIRLPLRPGGREQLEKLHRWLPSFAPHLPLALPVPVAEGAPTDEYPSPWSVVRWLEGESANIARLADPRLAAEALGRFVEALRALDPTDGPAPGEHNFLRGVPLAAREEMTRTAIAEARDLVDHTAVTDAWERDLAAPVRDAPPVWVHGDLTPANLLLRDGRLCGVLDWGGLGVGDPATDLLPAWSLFEGESRRAYRRAVGADEATWARGRGLALSVALVALPYYRETNPAMVRWARGMIEAVLSDTAS